MPRLHKYRNRNACYVLTAIRGAVITYQLTPEGEKKLTAAGSVVIYASTNLIHWSPIHTNPPTIGPWEYFDSVGANQPKRFYRASEIRQ